MKALKYYYIKRTAVDNRFRATEHSAKQWPAHWPGPVKHRQVPATLQATSLATTLATTLAITTLGYLGINNAAAQSNSATAIKVDIETCQNLNDSTALDQESIKTRIACYSRDVEHLNQLVSQLMAERSELLANAENQTATVDEYKQELANRQDAMQRLEVRAAALTQQVDRITADRDQLRDELFSAMAESNDQQIQFEANKRMFENFSQSYVGLTNEIEELQQKLKDFQTTNTELSDQQLAVEIENQQLQSEQKELAQQISTLEQSVEGLQSEKEALEADLNTAQSELAAIKNQLAGSEELAQQRLNEIEGLKSALADSEQQRVELETTIASLNKQHLDEITALNGQTGDLNSEIESLKQQQLTLEAESAAAADKLTGTVDQLSDAVDELNSTVAARDEQIANLAEARKALSAKREALITQITTLEKSHLEQTQTYKAEAATLQNEITALSAEKTELGLQLQEQNSANEELKAYANQSDEKNAELALAATGLQEKLDAADAQASKLQANIDELGQQSEADKTKFSQQVAALNSTIEQSQQDRNNLAAELDTIKPQLQTAENNLRASDEQNQQLLANVESLEAALEDATREQENLNAALLETEDQSKQANANLASLKENAETLSSLLAMSRAHSENTEATLTELRAEMSQADEALLARQQELESLLAEKTLIENELKAMAGAALAQAESIEQSLRDAGHAEVKVAVGDDNNINIRLGSGQLFRTGSSNLSAEGQQVLSDLATTFELASDRRIMINGHSDNVPLGPVLAERFKDNWGLSMARALATADFFADEAGIGPERMTVSGLGATQPIADNETPEGRQQNRRVEISLVPMDDTVASAE